MRLASVVGTALLSACGTGFAQDAVSIYGVGADSCGTYLDNRAKVPSAGAIYATWVYGLVSGHNLFTIGPQVRRDKIEEAAIVAYLDKHCQNKPFSNVIGGASSLMRDLGGWRPRQK